MVGIGPEFGAMAKLDAASHTLLLLRRLRGAPRPQSFGSKLSPANAVAWSSICRRKCVQKWMRNLRQLCAPSRPSRTGSQRVPSCYRGCVRPDPHARAARAQLFHTSAAVQLGGHRGRVLRLKAGDIAVPPAGTGHQSSAQATTSRSSGAYPPSGTYDELQKQQRPQACSDDHFQSRAAAQGPGPCGVVVGLSSPGAMK